MPTASVRGQRVSAVAAAAASPVSDDDRANAPEQAGAGSEQVFSFGPHELFPRRRLLLKAGAPLQLGSRSLDILIMLAERCGEVVGKTELIARVWPGVNVEDGALRVHIAMLRKTLGDGIGDACYVKTLPGRGYCLIATAGRGDRTATPGEAVELRTHHAPGLPLQLDRIVDRTDSVPKISDLLELKRFVTIHGPGGSASR